FVRRFFGTGEVLGKVIERGGPEDTGRMTIVGIAEDRPVGLSRRLPSLSDGSMIYELMDPSAKEGYLVVDAPGGAAGVADGIRTVLDGLTSSPTSVRTFKSMLVDRAAGLRRVQTLLLRS